jgi:ubiquinone/menaquinone biosynthesis C-methylase UbiE
MSVPAAPSTSPDVLENLDTFARWRKDYYEAAALRHYDKAIARMVSVLKPSPGHPVLDAGCGTGVHSIRVARLGHAVKAIDISRTVLEDARQRATAAGIVDKIDFEQADLTNLQYADGRFETIFCWGVLIHVPDIDKALRELVRVLKPGGRLALQMTNMTAFDHKLERVARLFRGKGKLGERQPFGQAGWCKTHGQDMFWMRADFAAFTKRLTELGCRRIYRCASEFTELQRRVGGPLRWGLRKMNDLWFNLNLPAVPACTCIYVYQKSPSAS